MRNRVELPPGGPLRQRAAKPPAQRFCHQLLRVDIVRKAAMRIRYFYFVFIRRRLRTAQGVTGGVAETTVSHNLRNLIDAGVMRSDILVKPLSVLECLDAGASILCVGPRMEGELYNLAANGFDLRHVRGLDLISYSPRIDLGDMHAMPYADSSWDAVVCGWTLAYSDNKASATTELVRVCRPGGVIAVAVEYNPKRPEEIEATLGYVPGSRERIESLRQLLALFAPNVGAVYFSYEPTGSRRASIGSIVAIFSVDK